ncbi:DNA-binding Lrp family transcriptional regulator [Kribbella sp. VKM Ac-2527]|uniref:DNA-binding Lrp family transcriptional regulator n=1 Tax=Kribbella caucasensis TaxID=2512215 RepID=A0A4R6KQI4_9ACTN|nr:Lrp/AsnC family transcriptional regulator [Kribbella sp. VKM Ac-2527]TDO54821.1 DNA-binding Lrp family transcriptional regulator [Kribbella sp. VKM Ac-2527]
MDEVDFALINALQVSPRASWSQLEAILGVDATTLSRRWARLVESGLAWSSCFAVTPPEQVQPPAGVVALVEVSCVAGDRENVIERIAPNPSVLTIECTSGSRELILTLSFNSVTDIDTYVATELAAVPGVLGTRTHYTRTFFKEGTSWRPGVLTPRQVRALHALPATGIDAPAAPTRLHDQVIAGLAGDIRRSATSIADEIGKSVATVTRAIGQILHAPWARTRIDFAHNLVGYNASVMVWFSVPHHQLETVGAGLAVLPETRMCCSVINSANLAVVLWLRNLREFDAIEAKIARAFPSAQIADRWMLPRFAKRIGHILTPTGLHTDFIRPTRTPLPLQPTN